MITVVDVSKDYLEYVLTRLRKDDEFEMICEFGEDYFNILIKECLNPEIKIMLDEQGFPIGLFGIRETSPDVAEVCLLVTDDFKKQFKSFLKQAKGYINSWISKYERLENFVYKHNKQAIKWLEVLGFRLVDFDEMKMYFFMEKINEY